MASPWGSRFDSVVMLTWSNWKTEPRSNRYHYATRFARNVPVLFVQPDVAGASEEPTEVDNLSLLHVGTRYDENQLLPVRRALDERGLSKPLLWFYNHHYTGLDRWFGPALRIYHASEDYFSLWTYLNQPRQQRYASRQWRLNQQRELIGFLQDMDLVVSVTSGVARSTSGAGAYDGPMIVVENGCDYAFWSEWPQSDGAERDKVAIYQGGINERLDVPLLVEVMRRLPDWEFRFCGVADTSFRGWHELQQQKNFRYLGKLDPAALREALYDASVGLIPFVQYPLFTEQSLPLKAFEYAACGLPVVSVPIASLSGYRSIFRFATTADEFCAAIVREAASRRDPTALTERRRLARAQDYDLRFADLSAFLEGFTPSARSRSLRSLARLASVAAQARWYRALGFGLRKLDEWRGSWHRWRRQPVSLMARRLAQRAAAPLARALGLARQSDLPVDRRGSSSEYWTGFNVTQHHEFSTAAESLDYFHWRNAQYPGYIELMPVTGQESKVVLDYGCGPGHDVIGFGVYSKPRRLIAVDVSPTSIAEARHRAGLHGFTADFIRIDERDPAIPVDTASVDYIHSSGVLHHTPDPVAILRELKRILAPGGRMRIMVYNYDSIWLHLYVAYQLRIAQGAHPGLSLREVFTKTTDGENCPIANVYRPAEFGALAAQAGLACRFLGAGISNFELKLAPQRLEAIMDRRLPAEHREFLAGLAIDRQGCPVHEGARAGVDGCYELAHP